MKKWKNILWIVGLTFLVSCGTKVSESSSVDHQNTETSSVVESIKESIEENIEENIDDASREEQSLESQSTETKSGIELAMEEENELKRSWILAALLKEEPDNIDALKMYVNINCSGELIGEVDFDSLKSQLDKLMEEVKGKYAIINYYHGKSGWYSDESNIDLTERPDIYIYDAEDRLVYKQGSIDFYFGYDDEGHMTERGGVGNARFSYDENGRLSTAKDKDSTYSFSYDEQGRIVNVKLDNSVFVKYEYNSDGSLKRFEAPNYYGKGESIISEFIYNENGYVTKNNYQGHVGEDKVFKYGKRSKDYSGNLKIMVDPHVFFNNGILKINGNPFINDLNVFNFTVKVVHGSNKDDNDSDINRFLESHGERKGKIPENAITVYTNPNQIWEYYSFLDKDGVNRIITQDYARIIGINDISDCGQHFYAAKGFQIEIKNEKCGSIKLSDYVLYYLPNE